jgi:hypothetical protein
MVTQVRLPLAYRDEIEKEVALSVREGERLGFYTVIGEAGPITAFGLAYRAMIPVSLALRWLAAQTQGGYVVRDASSGRYRTWCILPDREAAS